MFDGLDNNQIEITTYTENTEYGRKVIPPP